MTSRHLRPGSIEAVRHCRLRGILRHLLVPARMTHCAPEVDIQVHAVSGVGFRAMDADRSFLGVRFREALLPLSTT